MRILKGFKAHFIYENCDALLSKNNVIYHYEFKADKVNKIISLKYDSPILNLFKFRLLKWLLRGDIHHIVSHSPEELVVFFDKKIFRIKNHIEKNVYNITTCRRPINLCIIKNEIIWGDYVMAKTPQPVNIFSSINFGMSWTKKYTFDKGKIRHIHNIQYDRYRKHYWILTGDKDEESGLWATEDFRTVTPFLLGSQKYRSTAVIIEKDGLIIPSDTEYEENYIRLFSFAKNDLTDVLKVNGSCIAAKKINGNYFVSTMYEPNVSNKHKFAELWSSPNGKKWEKVLSFKKHWISSSLQHPIISIPHYIKNYKKSLYYFSTIATKDGDNTYLLEI